MVGGGGGVITAGSPRGKKRVSWAQVKYSGGVAPTIAATSTACEPRPTGAYAAPITQVVH